MNQGPYLFLCLKTKDYGLRHMKDFYDLTITLFV